MPTVPNARAISICHAVQQAYDELIELINGPLSTLRPFQLYQAPSPDGWSVMENLAHIVEFMPYWADEVTQLLASPARPFGRTHEHEGRLNAIHEHGRDTLAQIQAELPGSYAALESVLVKLTDKDLELTGIHSRRGEQTLAWFLDEFVVTHLQDHIQQIRSCL
jgi:uncharacterized damage-inducible protein DinB